MLLVFFSVKKKNKKHDFKQKKKKIKKYKQKTGRKKQRIQVRGAYIWGVSLRLPDLACPRQIGGPYLDLLADHRASVGRGRSGGRRGGRYGRRGARRRRGRGGRRRGGQGGRRRPDHHRARDPDGPGRRLHQRRGELRGAAGDTARRTGAGGRARRLRRRHLRRDQLLRRRRILFNETCFFIR